MINIIGQSLGRYHIIEQLGEGGMATVYKAYDTRLERDVAVKVIRVDQFAPAVLEHVLKRFEREAKALARLTHPNIVHINDYGEQDGIPYLVMDFLPGGTLKPRLGRPIPWQEAARLLVPVADALGYAHEHGIIHRDVKPSNILLTDKGQPMLTDFGIAKILETEGEQTLTGTGVGIGTPEYMAPEQISSKNVDQRADIYALGIVFFEMLTGRRPFEADTPLAVLVKQANEPLPRPRQFCPDLPESVERVLFKALAKQPQDRYQSMDEFSRALGGLTEAVQLPTAISMDRTIEAQLPAKSQPEAASQTSPVPVTIKLSPSIKPKKWSRVIGGAAILVILGVGLLAGFLLFNKNQPGSNLAAIATKTPAPPIPATPTTNAAPILTAPTANVPPTIQLSGCSDPIGCVKIGPTDSIHIAYLLVVAGPNSALGVDSRNGVEIAIDDAGGKMLNHPIKFDGEDGGCSADGGQAAGSKLAADPTIVAVIGTSCSSEARAAEPLLSAAGFVTISSSNTAPDLTDPTNKNHYPGYFRTAHNDKIQGAAAADFAYNFLKFTKAATIHDGSLYADSLQKVFADNFKKLGGTITLQTSVTVGQTDMSSVLASVASGSPQLIYFPIFLPEGAFLIRQARITPGLENTRLMGADGLYSPDVMKTADLAVEGFLVSSPLLQGAAYDAFVAKYVKKFGVQPINIFHAHAYDGFNIVKAAVEKVAVQQPDGTIYIPRQALRDAMAATRNFQGLTGVLTCNPDGDCANPVIGVYEYHAGAYPPVLIWH